MCGNESIGMWKWQAVKSEMDTNHGKETNHGKDTRMGNPVVDVIVPVYRPDDKFYKLLQQLKQQTWPVHRIILMNTEKKF